MERPFTWKDVGRLFQLCDNGVMFWRVGHHYGEWDIGNVGEFALFLGFTDPKRSIGEFLFRGECRRVMSFDRSMIVRQFQRV